MRARLFGLVVSLLVGGCGGVNLDSVCGANISCSAGGTYKQCTSGAGTGAYFVASDGTEFHCVSASDCTDARGAAVKWCSTH